MIKRLLLLFVAVAMALPTFAQTPINLLRVNGTTVSTGSGSADSGTLRVALSSDASLSFSGNAAASNTGSAVPTAASYTGVNVGGTLRGATGTNTSGSVYALDVNCASGCSGGTTDADDGTIAAAQSTGLSLALTQVFDGTNWKRFTVGVAGTASAQVITVQGIVGMTPILATVSDGSGALNVIADSGTITAVTTITNPVTVTDGTGALNVICDSGCSGGTQYAEDTAHSSGDTLTLAGVLQKTADGAISTDGDRSLLQVDENGFLKVNIKAGAGSGGTALADDADFTAGTTSFTPTGGFYQSSVTACTDGDTCALGITAQREVKVSVTSITAAATGQSNNAGSDSVVISSQQIGTAGTAATAVLSVQGIASMTPILATVSDGSGALNVICDSGCSGGVQYTQDAALTVATSVGTMAMGRASAAAPTGVSADDDAVMPWYLRSGAVATQPTYGGVLAVAGNGASGTGVQRVTIANDSTGILAAVTTITNPVTVTDGTGALNVIVDSGTVTTVSTVTTLSQLGGVAVPVEDAAETAAGTGIYAMAVRRDAPASSAGTTGDNALLALTSNGAVWTSNIPNTTGGWDALNATAADGATACTSTVQAIKASAGTFGGYFINNPNTADTWVHIYNVASGSVTVGTTAPKLTFRIPGVAANSVGANLEITNGVNFDTAMALACTTTAGGTGNPSAAVEANIFFK